MRLRRITSIAGLAAIIASTNTPWKEVEEYHCGKWVDNTVDDTKNAIESLLKSDYIRMGKNGQKYITKFEWKNIAKNFVNIFKEIKNEK